MRGIAAVAALLLAAAAAPTGQARLADKIVPGPVESVSLAVPTSRYAAWAAMNRVLEHAGVRMGAEGPALDPAAPDLDLSLRAERTEQFGGKRLGDVLDTIAAAAPALRWTEQDGAIVIRSSAPNVGILDRVIDRVALTDASPRVALSALVAALDPARGPGFGITGMGRRTASPSSGAVPQGRNVTLQMTRVTVLELLTAIARENGALSWSVRYDAAPASVETAVITFIEHGEPVTAASMRSLRQDADPQVSISVGPTLTNMVQSYAMRLGGGIRVSIEEAEGSTLLDSLGVLRNSVATGTQPLLLPRDPAVAMPRIVAFDSRYEVRRHGEVWTVRPKPGQPSRLDVLDAPVDGFIATNEPAGDVIARIGRVVGQVRNGPGRAGGPSPIDAAMAVPISVRVAAPATVRDVLNEIARVTGWLWSLRPQFTPGRPSVLSMQWRSAMSAPGVGNWSTGVSIMMATDLSPAPMPTRPVPHPIAPALDRTITPVTLPVGGDWSTLQELALHAQAPMGIEDAPRPARPADPRYRQRVQPGVPVGPGKLSDAIYVVLERQPGRQILATDAIINVAPTTLVTSPAYPLNRRIDEFTITNMGFFRAVGELRARVDPGFVAGDWQGPAAAALNRPVTLAVRGATVRDILNQLTAQHGRVVWRSSFDDGRAVPETWTLTLASLVSTDPPIRMAPRQSFVDARTPVTMPPGTGLVPLDLPVTGASVERALRALSRTTNTNAGLVFDRPPVDPGSAIQSAEYYDLTGLSLEAALARLRELAPAFSYTLSPDTGMLHVLPVTMPENAAAWLGLKIARFERTFENYREALSIMAAIRTPPATGRGGPPLPPLPAPTPIRPVPGPPQPRIELALTNVTVRDILDEIARKHTGFIWTIGLTSTQTMSLSFGTAGGSSSTSIR